MASPPRIVVVGASAGGIDAISDLLRELPEDFPAAVAIVLHLAASSPSLLPHILGRVAQLPVVAAADGLAIRPGTVYVAIPDHHLVVEGARLRLEATGRVNGHRPAVDPLFCSAAEHFRERVAGVVLSGTRDDGTVGLARIHRLGGTCLVQDPEDARHEGMPRSAMDNVAVDAVLSARALGRALLGWAADGRLPPGSGTPPPAATLRNGDKLTTVCPDCGGVLSEHAEGTAVYWECHVGHRYGPRTLADRQGIAVESALWTAVRALEDRQALLARIADQAEGRGHGLSAGHFRLQAQTSSDQADRVRGAIDELTQATGLGDTLAAIEEVEG